VARGLIPDCGCGEGLYSKILSSKGEVLGTDIEKKYLVKSLYSMKVVCSITHLPFVNKVFDFTWVCAVIEHVKDDCIEEVIRISKKAVFVTPNKHSPADFFKGLVGKDTWAFLPGHVRLYGIGELKKYGKVYGDGPGISELVRLLPSRFWLLLPRLSDTLILYRDIEAER